MSESDSDSSGLEDPEKFFAECLELGICGECCKSSGCVFLFPPNCEHRLCVDCCLALPLESDVQHCPTCKKPFQTDLLTPDYVFKGIWEDFSKALDKEAFERLVAQSEASAKSLREREKAKEIKSAQINDGDFKEIKSCQSKKDQTPGSAPRSECPPSPADSDFLGFPSPGNEDVTSSASFSAWTLPNIGDHAEKSTEDITPVVKVKPGHAQDAEKSTENRTPVVKVKPGHAQDAEKSTEDRTPVVKVKPSHVQHAEKSTENRTPVVKVKPSHVRLQGSTKAQSNEDELAKNNTEIHITPVTKAKPRRGRPPGSAKTTQSKDGEHAEKDEEVGTSSKKKRRGGRPPGSAKLITSRTISTSEEEDIDDPRGQPLREDVHAVTPISPATGSPCSSYSFSTPKPTRTKSSANPGSSTPFTSPKLTRTPSSGMLKRNSKLETPIHEYCSLGCQNKRTFSLDKLREMLAAGANPNTLDGSGISPIHESISCDRFDIMEVLLESGALVNCYRNDPLWTPLHEAVNKFVKQGIKDLTEQSIPYKVLTLLLDSGASLNLKDEFRRTPWDIAVENPAIFNLFKVYKRKPIERVEMLAPEPPMVVLFCTNDSKHQLAAVKKFSNRFKVKCLPGQCGFKPGVTHLVFKTGTKEANHVMRLGILSGCYIVSMEWVNDSLKRDELMPEAEYEIPGPLVPNSHDVFVTRRARMDRLHMRPRLFTGGMFHVLPGSPSDMTNQLRAEIQELIRVGGGTVLQREPKDHNFGENQPKLFHAEDDSKWKNCSVFVLYARAPNAMFQMDHMKHEPISWFLDCVDTYSIRPD